MDRSDLQQLSKEQLIELVLRLQRPDKNSRTSSKPPSTDKKEKRENSRPGGAKLGHEPHNRRLADDPDEFRDHTPSVCEQCGGAFSVRRREGIDRRIRRDRDPAGQTLCHPPPSLRLPMRALRRRGERLRRPRWRRRRRLVRAFMRWRFISRASRRCPMSGCAACSAMRSG